MKAKTAILIALVGIGTGLILTLKFGFSFSSSEPSATGPSTPVHEAVQPSNPLDLNGFYDDDPSFNAPGCWETVPRGLQTLGGIPFRIDGLLQLWGEGPAAIGRDYRERIDGLPAAGKFETLYVLHASSFTVEEGAPIASVVFRYADGSSGTNLVHYGTESRDWWQPLAEHAPMPADSPSKVVWRGDHPSLPDWVKSLRLFGMGIPNPKPALEVKGVDLISTRSRVTWVVLAMTTGPSGLLVADPKLERDTDVLPEETTIMVTALDDATGRPIPGMRLDVTLFSGRRPRSYGIFTADKDGDVIIDLPPEVIKRLSFEPISPDYTASEVSWDVENGETIPGLYVYRLTKRAP